MQRLCRDYAEGVSGMDEILKLVLEAKKVIKKTNTTYYFNCPNCGNEASGGMAANGHLHVRCEHCNIAICQ